jgi:hypothetical protein
MREDEEESSSHLPLRPLFTSSSSSNRINYPREWEELMMPDKADIAKEHLKFGWRKGIFYVYFLALLSFIHQFPAKLQVHLMTATDWYRPPLFGPGFSWRFGLNWTSLQRRTVCWYD